MRTLEELRDNFLNRPQENGPTDWLGDSPQRFAVYTLIASSCDTVTEFGTYSGLSACAFLCAKPKKLVCVDPTPEYLHCSSELKAAAVAQRKAQAEGPE